MWVDGGLSRCWKWHQADSHKECSSYQDSPVLSLVTTLSVGVMAEKLKQNSKNTCNDVDFQASGSDFFLNGRVLKWNSTHKVLLASLLLPEYRSKSVAAHRWSQLLLILLLMPAEALIVQVAPPLANKCPALEGFWASPRFKSILLHFFTHLMHGEWLKLLLSHFVALSL